jgi:hypothetical protein
VDLARLSRVAARAEFAPELPGVLDPLCVPRGKVGQERIEAARAHRVADALRERRGGGEASHGAEGQPEHAGDARERFTGRVPAPDILVVRTPALARRRAGLPLGGAAWERRRARAQVPGTTGRLVPYAHGEPAQAPADNGEPALEHLAHVQQEVPAVGDLHGPGEGGRDRARVFGRAVAGHERHLGMATQPARERRPTSVGQEVHDAPGVQVDEDGAVRLPFADRPVIHTQGPGRWARRQRHAADQPQQRVGTRRHADLAEHARGALGARLPRGHHLRGGEAVRAPGMPGEEAGQPLGERAAPTGGLAAGEPAHAQREAHAPAERGEVRGPAHVGAVHGGAPGPTTGAARPGGPRTCDEA